MPPRRVADTIAVENIENLKRTPLTGADFMLVIDGHEELMFDVQTNAKPTTKSEGVEFFSFLGIKHSTAGIPQRLNTIPITFMLREGEETKFEIEDIIDNDNENVSGKLYSGKNLSEMRLSAEFKFGHFTSDDGGEVGVENGTTVDKYTVQLLAHYRKPDDRFNIVDLVTLWPSSPGIIPINIELDTHTTASSLPKLI